MKRFFSLTLASIMAVCLLAGCAGGGTGGSTAASAEPSSGADASASSQDSEAPGSFKIGGIGPLTGDVAIYGNAAKHGAEIAAEEINALGNIRLELRFEDDEHDAEKAVNAYNTLKDWGMQISLGTVTTTPGIAVAQESFTDRIFALTPSASAVAVTEGKDNVFQMCFADPNQGSASAQYISDKALGTKIAVIYKNDDAYSAGIYETFISKAGELGLEIVTATTFTGDSQTDFSVQLNDAKQAGADLVFLPIYYTPASLILQQAASIGYAPKFFGVDGMDGILTLEGFDASLAEGVVLLTPFNADATDERTVSFVSKYRAAYGEVPNQFAADSYDCVYAIYQAIMEDGGITPDMSPQEINDKLVARFADFSFSGLTGDNMTWASNGQVTKAPKGMVIQSGSYVGMD